MVTTPAPRNRRQEDPQFAELIRLARENQALITGMQNKMSSISEEMEGMIRKVAILERSAYDTRKIQEDFKVDQLNPKQRSGLPDLLDWWIDRKEEAEGIATKLARNAQRSAILQGITAVVVLALAVYAALHR